MSAKDDTPQLTNDEGFSGLSNLQTHISESDGALRPESVEMLLALGMTKRSVDAVQGTFRDLHAMHEPKRAELTESLYNLTGGKAEFDALVEWGKANLTSDERTQLDHELNGPSAAKAIALVKRRRRYPWLTAITKLVQGKRRP